VTSKSDEGMFKHIISAIQICIFVIMIITLYFNPDVPQDAKPIILLSLVVVFANIYFLLEINTIKKELRLLQKKARTSPQ